MLTSRFLLTIAYDGTCYAGWQTQKTGVGVQQLVEEALRKLFPGSGPLQSSSRTDTGVHALGMAAHVDIPRAELRMPPRKLLLAVNAHLPEDIRVTAVRQIADDCHARFDAVGKEYRYWVWNHAAMNPLLRHSAWQVTRRLDLRSIRTAAAAFIGTHDFRSFAANRGYLAGNTVRTLTRCEVRRQGALLTFRVAGNGFLYKMVRGLVGTLVQVGLGKIAAGEMPSILSRQDRRGAGMTAPAHGLVLWKVQYPSSRRGRTDA